VDLVLSTEPGSSPSGPGADVQVGVAPMSDALLGVLIGLFGSVLVQVFLQAILMWREKQERARSVRLAPLDSLLPVVDSVAAVLSHHMEFVMFRSSGVVYPYSEKLHDAAVDALTRVQRARVSMMAIGAPSEIFAVLDDVTGLLSSVASATEERQAVLIASIQIALSQIGKQYMSLRLSSDKLM